MRSEIPFSQESQQLLAAAEKSADLLSHRDVGDYNLLLGLLSNENCPATKVLRRHGISAGFPTKQIPPFNPDNLPPVERRRYELEMHLLELFEKNDFRSVLTAFDEALTNPDLDRTLVVRMLGSFGYATAMAIGDLNLARHYEELRLELDSENIQALFGVASCLKRLGKTDEALKYARKCYQLGLSQTGAIAESTLEMVEKQFPEVKFESPKLS